MGVKGGLILGVVLGLGGGFMCAGGVGGAGVCGWLGELGVGRMGKE
jgi:hypothetical protein